jgi:hypothetical protein
MVIHLPTLILLRLLVVSVACGFSSLVFAISYVVSPLTGLMQQPNSQYYHLAYGASVNVINKNRQHALTAVYFERPEFSAEGFDEQETLAHIQWQIFASRTKYGDLMAGVGFGKVSGYVSNSTGRSSYSMNALVTSAEIVKRWKSFELAAGHTIYVGGKSEEELNAYVAWPFLTLQLRMGFVI